MKVSLLLSRVALVAACAVLPTRAQAAGTESETGRFAVTGEVDVVSQYVWRTLAYSEGTVVQPSATLTGGPVELNLWANVDPSLEGPDRLNEVDYSLALNLARGPFEATSSLLLYTYPRLGSANTGELQFELRAALPRGLGPFVRHSTDVFDYPGASFTLLGLEREWEFENGGSLTLSTQVGRGSLRFSDAYLPGAPALRVAGLGVSWSVPLVEGWAVRPHVDWLEVVDADARALLPSHTPLTFGVAFGRL